MLNNSNIFPLKCGDYYMIEEIFYLKKETLKTLGDEKVILDVVKDNININ